MSTPVECSDSKPRSSFLRRLEMKGQLKRSHGVRVKSRGARRDESGVSAGTAHRFIAHVEEGNLCIGSDPNGFLAQLIAVLFTVGPGEIAVGAVAGPRAASLPGRGRRRWARESTVKRGGLPHTCRRRQGAFRAWTMQPNHRRILTPFSRPTARHRRGRCLPH